MVSCTCSLSLTRIADKDMHSKDYLTFGSRNEQEKVQMEWTKFIETRLVNPHVHNCTAAECFISFVRRYDVDLYTFSATSTTQLNRAEWTNWTTLFIAGAAIVKLLLYSSSRYFPVTQTSTRPCLGPAFNFPWASIYPSIPRFVGRPCKCTPEILWLVNCIPFALLTLSSQNRKAIKSILTLYRERNWKKKGVLCLRYSSAIEKEEELPLKAAEHKGRCSAVWRMILFSTIQEEKYLCSHLSVSPLWNA